MVYLRMDNNRLKQLMTQKNPTEAPHTNSPESAPVSPAKDSNSNAPLTTPGWFSSSQMLMLPL